MTNCQVSVIIPAYNAGRYIRRCIDSALGQTCERVRVIVVDDNSTDNTEECVRSYGEQLRYIRLAQNRGPAAGRTAGLLETDTEFVAFLDADDYWKPEFVETTVGFLRNHPDAIAVNTAYCAKEWKGGDYDYPKLDDVDRQYYGGSGRICDNFYEYWAKYRSVLTGTVMMRTAVAKQTGGQREDLRLTQDLEFWGYLATFGKWGFVPQHLFVTDQRILTPRERLSKMRRRFDFFRSLTVESWIARVSPRLVDRRSIEAFGRIVAHIAVTIALANAYMFQFRRSRELALEWREQLEGGLGNVLRVGLKGGSLLWPLVCIALRYREISKAYAYPVLRRIGMARCLWGDHKCRRVVRIVHQYLSPVIWRRWGGKRNC